MSRKTIIVIGLAAAVVAAALVFDGVSRRRAANSGPAISQNPVTTPPAGGPANSSSPNAGTAVQPAVPSADTAPATETGEKPAPGVAAEAPTDDNAADSAAPAAPAFVVPAGTTLTVRLGQELGSKTSRRAKAFRPRWIGMSSSAVRLRLLRARMLRARSCLPDPLVRWRAKPVCNSN